MFTKGEFKYVPPYIKRGNDTVALMWNSTVIGEEERDANGILFSTAQEMFEWMEVKFTAKSSEAYLLSKGWKLGKCWSKDGVGKNIYTIDEACNLEAKLILAKARGDG